MTRKRVLILCTGNSCRSQMAEGMINHWRGDRWQAFSAGTEPAERVHPLAIAVMAEVGIDISTQRPKELGAMQNVSPDVVVTVCAAAAAACPVWPGAGRLVHLPFPDPAHATGTLDARLDIFRAVRDNMQDQLLRYLDVVVDTTSLPQPTDSA